MSEEEQKAIEKINYISDFIIENGQYNADVEDIEFFSIILNLISKLQEENNKKDKVIEKMAEKINQAYFDETNMWIWFEKEITPKNEQGKFDYKDIGTRKQRIKQYFYKKVEE